MKGIKMAVYHLKKCVVLFISSSEDLCYRYAVSEIQRLLNSLNCRTELKHQYSADSFFLGIDSNESMEPENVVYDGFRICLKENAVLFCAKEAKGILNAVYEFAGESYFRTHGV